MVAALLGRVRGEGMKLFNHEIEYLPVHPYDGIDEVYMGNDIRSAVVIYDNLLGVRCQYYFHAPAQLWTNLKVGGVMSTGGIKSIGVISKIENGLYTVQSSDSGESCHGLMVGSDKPVVGQQVVMFDSMIHDSEHFGEFTSAITSRLDLLNVLDVHSINILVFREGAHIGTIHIDPFTNLPNYDDLELWAEGHQWQPSHFAYK